MPSQTAIDAYKLLIGHWNMVILQRRRYWTEEFYRRARSERRLGYGVMRWFLVIVLPKQYREDNQDAWIAKQISKDKHIIEAQAQLEDITQWLRE